MSYEGKRNAQGLTPRQATVLEMDHAGKGPTEIAQELGIRTSQVGNIKKWLRCNGWTVSKLRRLPQEMQRVMQEVTVAEILDETIVPRSEHEPEDDEEPDSDEPAFTDLDRCHCGLIRPCYHRAVSPWQSVNDGNQDEHEQSPEDLEPMQSTRPRGW